MSLDKLSFNDWGRRVISVSRKGIKSILLLYETQEPETWQLAVGGFLVEIPRAFREEISDFLAGYAAIGTSA